MFKIWAKLLDEDRRIIKDTLYKEDAIYDDDRFFDYLTSICHTFDVSVPTVLSYHKDNFKKFSYVKFMPRDFIEQVDFHALTLEYSNDDKKKKREHIKDYL